MAQFDVHRNPRGGRYPLLLDVQAELLASLATRVVVPLTRARTLGKPITHLNPVVTINGVDHIAVFQELAAIPTTALGDRVASLAARRSDIIAALDLLLTGA